MTTYNTGNPVPSADARDRYDNSQTLDEVVNGNSASYTTRTGKQVVSLGGMNSRFNNAQEARESAFNLSQEEKQEAFQTFLDGSGWSSLGAYGAGVVITSHTQTVDYLGQPYSLKPSIPASLDAPYVTTGNWATEGVNFKLVGDNSLRQDLANPAIAPGILAVERSALSLAISNLQIIISLSPSNPWEKAYVSLITSKPVLADWTTWDWAPAINACMAANSNVILTSVFNIAPTSKLTLNPGQNLFGTSNRNTGIITSGTGYLFEMLNANGTAEVSAPSIKNMWVRTGGRTFQRLNSKTGGFTDNASSQSYMMRPLVEDCIIESNGTGTGIEWNKCFNGVINRSKIQGFDTALDLTGCDSISVGGQTRFVANGVHVRAKSAGTFGSGLNLGQVEMLAASATLVVSDYRDLIIDESYLEQTFPLSSGVAFDITGGLHFSQRGNRIEIPAANAPILNKVTGDFFTFVKAANKHSGAAWGPDEWNGGAGALYWKNALNRQKIIVEPNASDAGIPFATLPAQLNAPKRFKSAWEINPSGTGLSNADQGVSVRVKNNAFVLPYSGTAQYSFYDTFRPITGNVNVYIKAYASVEGLSMTIQRRNGGTVTNTGAQVLSTTPTWYQLYTNVSVTDLRMYFLNRDLAASGQALIEWLIVDYV